MVDTIVAARNVTIKMTWPGAYTDPRLLALARQERPTFLNPQSARHTKTGID
jgi:hypothetical protein